MEIRKVHYVTHKEIRHLSEHHKLYKYFEWSELCADRCQSTYRGDKLEYAEGLITLDPNGRIEVHQSLVTIKRQMAKMRRNVDRLVLFECTGWCAGQPQRAHPRKSGWTSVMVDALRLDVIIIDNRMKGGE